MPSSQKLKTNKHTHESSHSFLHMIITQIINERTKSPICWPANEIGPVGLSFEADLVVEQRLRWAAIIIWDDLGERLCRKAHMWSAESWVGEAPLPCLRPVLSIIEFDITQAPSLYEPNTL